MSTVIRSRCVNIAKKFLAIESLSNVSYSAERASFRFQLHTSAFLNVKGMDIKMPSLSPTMTMGTIVKWHKKEGDPIAPGDVLCDIQTDKAVMSFETEEEGILAKVLIPEGTSDVQVGALIGLIVNEGEDWKSVELPSDSESSIASEASSESTNTATDEELGIQRVLMPSLSPTMSEGTIVKWCKQEGDPVAPGDVLCEIQTDKAVMSFETEEEGILAKILVKEGTAGVQVNSMIAVLVPEGADWKNVKVPSSSARPAASAEKVAEKSPKEPASAPSRDHLSYGPAVRILLELYQIDGSKVTATGRNKKILKSDVLNYVTANKLQPKPPTPVPLPKKSSASTAVDEVTFTRKTFEKYTDIELSSMRKTIANRLTISKTTIPHAYATVTAEVDDLLSLRKQMKSAGVNVSVNDFVIKAVALALKQCPHVNKLYIKDEVVDNSAIDISVAVATDSGLITPIVKQADQKSVDEISAEIKELAKKARLGKLQLHEFQGGSFTISNLGMFGISEFSAIINPPQCAILAVGGGRQFVDINKNAKTKMTSTLSFDSRAISESAAADFLETVQWLLQNPVNIVIGASKKAAARSA
ncbi:pyruvate dehydrogenase protein X component-like [Planococcus citri]|uniref:pyruvate dehydrogenase protein X component-like n=1 Tax=Planococcus citri TaxID=170843 RepID=UPI0031F9CFB6